MAAFRAAWPARLRHVAIFTGRRRHAKDGAVPADPLACGAARLDSIGTALTWPARRAAAWTRLTDGLTDRLNDGLTGRRTG